MSFNLIDSVKGFFNDDLISKAGNLWGENEKNISRAASAAVPAVLAGLLNKAGSGDAGSVLSMAKNAFDSSLLPNSQNYLGTDFITQGADMLKGIFGNRLSDVANNISGFAGIRPTSAASLMSMTAPAALSALGKHAEVTGMDSAGLLRFLNGQKDKILTRLPSGLNLPGALGLDSITSIGNKLSSSLSGLTGTVKNFSPGVLNFAEKPGSRRWVLPLLVAAGVVALIALLAQPKKSVSKQLVTTALNAKAATAPDTFAAAVSIETIKVKLPNGVVLNAFKGGIEDQLVSFLNDPSRPVDKNTWFDFDNLNFESGSAMITAQSQQQVDNIAAILKAYPHVVIKIGGYTDRTGDNVSNLRLSQARAEAVVASLKTSGSKASQLADAEGYGSQFAKAAIDAPDEEKRKDRRISVNVRNK